MKFQRNCYTFSIDEQHVLWNSCAIVIGCGGGGGTLAELLVRIGVGNIVLIDGDVYEESNQNRQIGCTESTIGKFKTEVLKQRFLDINNHIKVFSHNDFLTKDNYQKILEPYFKRFDNVVISDTADGYKNKKLIDDICKEFKIPHVSGGVGFYMGWTATIDQTSIDDYLSSDCDEHIIYPAPTIVWLQASLQAQQVLNLLLKRNWNVTGKRIFFNLMTSESSVTDPNEI